jgi:putative transposase
MTRRRRQRLPLDAYEVPGSTWHITTTVARPNGSPFRSIEFGLDVLDGFATSCQAAGAIPYLVCIMPDHLHALLEVRSDDLIKVVGRAKSETTRQWWARGGVGALWQESFHDHGIRGAHDFEATVTYLLNIPVEAGLAQEGEADPLIGGSVIADG